MSNNTNANPTKTKDGFYFEIEGKKYSFRKPKGRDLARLEERLNVGEGGTIPNNTETLAVMLALLQVGDPAECYDADGWLDDAPLSVLKTAGVYVMDLFRA